MNLRLDLQGTRAVSSVVILSSVGFDEAIGGVQYPQIVR